MPREEHVGVACASMAFGLDLRVSENMDAAGFSKVSKETFGVYPGVAGGSAGTGALGRQSDEVMLWGEGDEAMKGDVEESVAGDVGVDGECFIAGRSGRSGECMRSSFIVVVNGELGLCQYQCC
ncbi:hypothetical protein BD779DRAFT_1555284 [Infundibulicybe gibba]|nr:hypothetical protein BD779DRAFT_1555284 [Infundibulicybe gibba]